MSEFLLTKLKRLYFLKLKVCNNTFLLKKIFLLGIPVSEEEKNWFVVILWII